jgi:cytosine/adenosine deaminase-related metal-dependent hydrolase
VEGGGRHPSDRQRVISATTIPNLFHAAVVCTCSPFSVTGDLMRQTAALARSYEKVYLHTHVAETRDEERFCLEKFGVRPEEYMRQLGWVGPDVWWAHAIWLDEAEIQMLAETGTGVAHCPSSNMRLGSGIAKIRQMRQSGVKVGIALDGSASNDANDLLLEARMAMLLQRVAQGASAFTVLEALELATLGSAAVIGRADLGQLAPGKAADFIGVRLDRLELAGGAVHDPAAALLLCTPHGVDLSVINGGWCATAGWRIDLEPLIGRHNQWPTIASRHPVVFRRPHLEVVKLQLAVTSSSK